MITPLVITPLVMTPEHIVPPHLAWAAQVRHLCPPEPVAFEHATLQGKGTPVENRFGIGQSNDQVADLAVYSPLQEHRQKRR